MTFIPNADWRAARPAMLEAAATARALAFDLNGYASAYAHLAALVGNPGATGATENDLIAASDRAAYYENILPGSFEAHDRAVTALASR